MVQLGFQAPQQRALPDVSGERQAWGWGMCMAWPA